MSVAKKKVKAEDILEVIDNAESVEIDKALEILAERKKER